MWVPSYGVNVSAILRLQMRFFSFFALTIYSHPHVFYPALHVLYFKHGDLQKAKIYVCEDWEWKGRRGFSNDDDVHKSLGEFNLKPDSCIMNVIKHFRHFHYEEREGMGSRRVSTTLNTSLSENSQWKPCDWIEEFRAWVQGGLKLDNATHQRLSKAKV